MRMEGEQQIAATPEAVFAALNDAEILQRCIPGCESLEKKSDTEMSAKVTLKIGPVKASFKGDVTLSNIVPPKGYVIRGEGSGGAAGFAKGSAEVALEEKDKGTLLKYVVDAQVGGKLAQVGSRLVDSTAKKLAGQFFEEFAKELDPQERSQGKEDARMAAPAKANVSRNRKIVVGAVLLIIGGLIISLS